MIERTKLPRALLALPLLVAGLAASAQEPDERAAQRAEMLERYDSDGDGRLSRSERDAARESRALERWDSDGDGSLSEAEREAAREGRRQEQQEIRDRYDADGDGRLSRSERENARADGARLGRPGGGGRRGGFRGGR